jgi:prophage antirepressor-like protein
LAACVLLTFYLDVSYRDMEQWLLATDAVCRALSLERIPDHTTLYRAYRRLRLKDLERMKRILLSRLEGAEELIATDSTGYRPTQASAYYQSRRGRTYREWLKGIYAVGTQSQLILAWRQEWGPGNDSAFLNGLRHEAHRYGRRDWMLLADAGFDGRAVVEGDLIPPIRRHGSLVARERKARAELVDAARLDGIYGQRWKCETVNSVIKRKFGDTIRSRKRSHQRREPAVKGLVYDLHR